MAGAIKGITIEFQGDTTKLDKALRQVGKEAKTTQNELRRINDSLKFNPRSVEMWKQKQTVLNNAIKDTKSKLDVMKKGLAEMSKQGLNSENSEEFRKLERQIEQTERQLKGFERELRSIGNANLQALGHQFKDIGAKATEVGKKLSMYVTGPLVGVGTVAAKGFAEVDKTMQLTNATMANTEEQAQMLNKAMKDAASASVYGMTDAATATLNFARAGLTAEQAAAALAPAMNLAAGEGGNLDVVSGGLVATINGFHGSFEDAARYADVFANACNNSALDVDSLSNAMSVAAPIFSAAGYSVEDAALYMGVMANNGIEADKAANSLKTGMARLVSPSKDAAGWMEKLGISIVNSDGTMKDSITVQKELNDAFKDLSESEQIAAASAIFGKNQMSPWLALINTAPGDVEALSSAIYEEGTASEMAANMMGGFGGALEQLKSGIDVAKVSLGEALAPIILKVAEGLQSLIDWFNGLSPSMQSVVAVIGTVVAAIGPLLVIFGTLMSSIGSIMINIGPVISMFAKLGPVLKGVGVAIKGVIGAFGWWGVAIAAAVAAAIYLYKNWDKVKAYAKKLWATIKPIFQKIGDFIKDTWDKAKNAVTTAWNTIVKTIRDKVNAVRQTITNTFNTIKNFISTVLNAIKATFTTVFNAIKSFITAVFKAYVNLIKAELNIIKTVVTTVLNAVKTIFTTVFNAIKTFVTAVFKGYVTLIKAELNIIKTVVTTVLNAVKTVFTTVFNAIKSFLSTVVQGWKNIISAAVNAIKTTVTTVFNSIKSAVTTIWNAIKNAITTPIQNAKNTVANVVNTIRDKVSGAFSSVAGKVRSAFTAVKDAITTPIQKAWDLVKSAVDKIKGIFPLKLGKIFSGIKLPHFKISGGKAPWGIGGQGVKPSIDIDWYKQGGIFKRPTIFATGSGFKGVGEAGAEAVLPLDTLWEQMAGMGNTIVQGVTANQQRQDQLLEQLVTLNALMLEQLKADKDFRIDGRVAGRIINDLVRV